MKTNQGILERFGAFLIIGLLSALALPALADNTTPVTLSPQQPNFYRVDTNVASLSLMNASNYVTGGTNCLTVTVRQNTGLSFFTTAASTNANSVNITLKFDVSANGTNFTTTSPLSVIVPTAYAGTNTYWTNIDRSVLNNVRAIRLTSATNAAVGTGNTNTVILQNLTYSYSGQ